MDRHARYIEIIDHLNEQDGRGEHYYRTPEGTINVWWGSGDWEHKWIELEDCPPAKDPDPETYDRCKRCEPKCDAATPPPGEVLLREALVDELLEMSDHPDDLNDDYDGDCWGERELEEDV